MLEYYYDKAGTGRMICIVLVFFEHSETLLYYKINQVLHVLLVYDALESDSLQVNFLRICSYNVFSNKKSTQFSQSFTVNSLLLYFK